MRKSQVLDNMREKNEILQSQQLGLMKHLIPLRKREKELKKCLDSLEHCIPCTNAMTARGLRDIYDTTQPARSRPTHMSLEGKHNNSNAYKAETSFAYEPYSTLKTTRAVKWPNPLNSSASPVHYPQSDVEVMIPENLPFRFRGHMMDSIVPIEEHKSKMTWQTARNGNETRNQLSNKNCMCMTAAQPYTHVRIQQGRCSFLQDTVPAAFVPSPREITMNTSAGNCRETHLPAHNGNYLDDANWMNASSGHSKGLKSQINQTIKQEPIDDMGFYTQPCVRNAQVKASSEEQHKQLDFHQDQQMNDDKSKELKKITAWLKGKSDIGMFSRQEGTLNETLCDLELPASNTVNSINFGHQTLNRYNESDIDVDGEPNTLKDTLSPLPNNVSSNFTDSLPVGYQNNFQTPEKQTILGYPCEQGFYYPMKQICHDLNSISNRSPARASAPFRNLELTHGPIGMKIKSDGSTNLKTSSSSHGFPKTPYMPGIQLDNIKREHDSSGIDSCEFEHTVLASRKQLDHEFNRKPNSKSNVAPLPFSFQNPEFASTAVRLEEGVFAERKPVTGFQQEFLQPPYLQDSQLDSVKREYTSSHTAEGNCKGSSDLLSIELSELEELLMD